MQKEIKDSIILIVEDNQTQQNIMQVFLKNYGFNFISAFNSVEAFKILDSILPDLILLDVMLPGIDGFEIAAKLKENSRTKDIPIIFITALRNESDIIKGLKIGGADYLGKPFNQEELVARVRTHLNLKLYRDKLVEQNEKLQEEILKQEKSKKNMLLSEEKFKKAFSLNPLPTIIAKTSSQVYLDINEAFLKWTGYSKEEVVGKTSVDFSLFIDLSQRNLLFHQFTTHKTVRDYPIDIKTKNGNIRKTLISVENIIINDENCYLGIFHDITEISELKENLELVNENFKKISEITSDFAFLISINKDFHINPLWTFGSYESLTGFKEEEVFGHGNFPLFIANNTNIDFDFFIEKIHTLKPFEEIVRLVKNQGEVIHLRAFIKPELKENDEYYIYGSVKDITELAYVQKELLKSELTFKQITEAANCLIGELTPQGKFIYANRGFNTILGYKPSDLIDTNFFELVHVNDVETASEKCLCLITSTNPQQCLMRLKTADNNYKWFSSNGSIVDLGDNEQKIIFVCVDVSNRIEAEIELRKYNDKLQELNITKDKFFSIIAHDLKGPVSSFNSVLNNLSINYKDISGDELESFIKTLNVSTGHLFTLLEDLLEWSRAQSGKIPYNPEEFSIKYLIDNIISLFDIAAKNKNIAIITEAKTDQNIFADVKMTSTIMRNLISNAIKFSPENSEIIISSDVFSDNNKEFLLVSIQDFGVGISKENISKLFAIESAYTTEGTASEKGTGLGLVLCREFIEKNNGKIWVESEIGKGSKFLFTLPISK